MMGRNYARSPYYVNLDILILIGGIPDQTWTVSLQLSAQSKKLCVGLDRCGSGD